MSNGHPYTNWQALFDAPRSTFFAGHTADGMVDRTPQAVLLPSEEALFTQSNARVLIGQAANGALRLVALPTQVYPAPTGEGEFGLGPGMYHHFDVAMYAGDLSYHIWLDGVATPVDLAADDLDPETIYADHFLPLTRLRLGELEVSLVSVAPVAPDGVTAPLAPAPLPGPAGAIYVLHVRNTGAEKVGGKIVLRASDLLVGHYEDATPALHSLKRPGIDLRQQTLILTRPEGAAGIHLHGGKWTKLNAPFEAECGFSLAPGEEAVFETHVAMGARYTDVLPVIYELHRRSALAWLNLTAGFWRSRLGQLDVNTEDATEDAGFSRDIYIRSLFDNFNCLQTDAAGNLIAHWQGAPSHGYGTIWGIDVEPTAVSVVHLCPEIARQVLLFFMTRSRAPKGPRDHSVPILVAPLIIARQWLQVTGDVAFLRQHPEIMRALQSIIADLLALQSPGEVLYPSRFSSDGPVGRRYDYGTNVKVYSAFDSFAYLLRHLGLTEEAERYTTIAQGILAAIDHTMCFDGPFGTQVSGGTNLGEAPGDFYLPEGMPYYDGEDTSSMLAPIYGACDFTHEPWVNYHRFARSMWCANYDPEFDVLRWGPGENGVFDGTAYFSRLGGSLTRAEMREAIQTLRQNGTDDATGSVFWWPHGREYKRALTRCSQGQGAWAWQYMQQWLGLSVDAVEQVLVLAPRGLLTFVEWKGYAAGPHRFDVRWVEDGKRVVATVTNHNDTAWTLRIGFRPSSAGAEGVLEWQTHTLAAGATITLEHQVQMASRQDSMDQSAVLRREIVHFGDAEGVVFKRFGPALLWGHWETELLWDTRAMPLSLRFVVVNATGKDWADVVVHLSVPEGWSAQGRLPTHWTRPDHMTGGTVRLHLGVLRHLTRTVAPFWVRAPRTFEIRPGWTDDTKPFHATTQPGPGLLIGSPDVEMASEVMFTAELRATCHDGTVVSRSLTVPVQVIPCR